MTSLEDLRWHWGEAYLVRRIGGRWVAQRRDPDATVSAEGPDRLRALIWTHYAARPCRFQPEGG